MSLSRCARTVVVALGCAISGAAAQAGELHLSDLMTCYKLLKPFSIAGFHATVYPEDQNIAIIPGRFAEHEGVFVYSDQGASFEAIAPAYGNKAVGFEISSAKGPLRVVYQPGAQNRKAQAWIRGPSGEKTSGITTLFKNADDPEKRAMLESDVDSMVRGMGRTWDLREDQLVEAVEKGKYLWLEVDLDHYRDAAKKCEKQLGDAPEGAGIRSSIGAEIEVLGSRAPRSGVVRDEIFKPSNLMSTPQY